MQPSNSQILDAILDLRGDVKVALDRTVRMEKICDRLESRQNKQGRQLAGLRGTATTFGGASGVLVTLIMQAAKAIWGAHQG